jgi:hypothetical protein
MTQRRRHWRGDEFLLLVQRYPDEGPRQLAIDLGRTTGAVDAMAARFRLRSLNRRTRQSQTRRQRNRLKLSMNKVTTGVSGVLRGQQVLQLLN